MAYTPVVTMRFAIAKQYKSRVWEQRVWGMPDNQVIAIYKRMQENGGTLRSCKPQPVTPAPPEPPPQPEEYYEQLCMFEPPRTRFKEMNL